MTDILRNDTAFANDDLSIREVVLDSGLVITLRVSHARRAPGGWRLATAQGADVMQTFERFFAALIDPPAGATLDDVFASLSINDVQTLVQAIAPFLAPPTSMKPPR